MASPLAETLKPKTAAPSLGELLNTQTRNPVYYFLANTLNEYLIYHYVTLRFFLPFSYLINLGSYQNGLIQYTIQQGCQPLPKPAGKYHTRTEEMAGEESRHELEPLVQHLNRLDGPRRISQDRLTMYIYTT